MKALGAKASLPIFLLIITINFDNDNAYMYSSSQPILHVQMYSDHTYFMYIQLYVWGLTLHDITMVISQDCLKKLRGKKLDKTSISLDYQS